MRQVWLAVAGVALLGGCSSIIEGSSQEISVNTTPPGANCTLNREGTPIGTITSTPGSVTIPKTKYDIEVVCELDGYQKTAYIDESGTAAATFGNILIGGIIGVVVDMSTGAANKYDSPLDIALEARSDIAPPGVVTFTPMAPLVEATPPVAARPVPAGPATLPGAMPVDPRRVDNAADRYRVLSRLAADGLVPQDRYKAWAQQNVGAFLLYTAPLPSAAVGNKAPTYDQLAEFLRSVAADKNRAVAEAERQSLFGTLMPLDGPRAKPAKPPVDGQEIAHWFLFLDGLRAEGILSADSVEAEKTAINDVRIAAGLAPVPLYSALAGGAVQ
jgi:hypothetical protein